MSCLQDLNVLTFSKGHNHQENVFEIFSKVNQVIYLSFPISVSSFKITVWIVFFLDILLTMFKCPNFQRAITRKNSRFFFSKVDQVIYSSFPISLSSLETIAQVILDILLTMFKGPNLQRAIIQEKNFGFFFSQVYQVIYLSSHPLSVC